MTRLACFTRMCAALLLLLCLPAAARAAASDYFHHDIILLRAGDVYAGALIAQPAVGSAASQLPLGLLDRSGRIMYAADLNGVDAHGAFTSLVQAVDTATGRVLRARTVTGYFSTAPGSYTPGALQLPQPGTANPSLAPGAATGRDLARGSAMRSLRPPSVPPIDSSQTLSALSFNGRWLALRDATPNASATHAIVIDTATLHVVATVRLSTSFGLDAMSGDGTSLYLIQQLAHAGAQAYAVRLYDLRRHRLDPRPLQEKGEADSTISGIAYTRVWSPRGDWLFTLYIQPGRRGVEVHALGVAYRQVHCIMLQGEGINTFDLAHFALAVAANGAALYAVNPLLGRIAAVTDGLPYGMPRWAALGRRAGSPARTQTGAVLSADGRTLFVATDRGVWAIDTHTLALRATIGAGHRVTSVALSPDGRRLYALEPNQGLTRIAVLNPATGRTLDTIAVANGRWAVWSIERVVSSQ